MNFFCDSSDKGQNLLDVFGNDTKLKISNKIPLNTYFLSFSILKIVKLNNDKFDTFLKCIDFDLKKSSVKKQKN